MLERAGSDLRASDAERDETIALLRGHHLAGRLGAEELEERIAEACAARFRGELRHALRELPVRRPAVIAAGVRRPAGYPLTALSLGIGACFLLVVSVGLLFPLILPLGASAWILGRRARRAAAGTGRTGMATAAEVLGIVATLGAFTVLVACAAFIAA